MGLLQVSQELKVQHEAMNLQVHNDNVLLYVLYYAADNDYGMLQDDLLFEQATPRQCRNISIVDDTALESDEVFSVNLTTVDLSVVLSPNISTVLIVDNDGMCVHNCELDSVIMINFNLL